MEYSATFEIRTVSSNGSIKWLGSSVFLSHSLAGRIVGPERIDNHLCNVHFGSFLIGKLKERERRFF